MNKLLRNIVLLMFALAWGSEAGELPKDRAASVEQRIATREFPSVFQAWNAADNLPEEDKLTTMARHDLVFQAPGGFGLRWRSIPEGLSTNFDSASIQKGQEMRRELLRMNPHIVLLAEIRFHDAHQTFLPAGHKWWKRGADGQAEVGWAEGGFLKLDFALPDFQRQVALKARAAMRSKVFDGVMLDWWEDDDLHLELIRKVRAAIGESALILVNVNDRKTPRTAPYINGYFMECYRNRTPADWSRIEDSLQWAEVNLRPPRINCVETWFHQSRADLNLMRATTALALTLSDGYGLFSDPNDLPTPDHLHNWYPFWAKSLGRPLGRGMKRPDGSWSREFARGTVLYNPMGNEVVLIAFAEKRLSRATGRFAKTHAVDPADGDIFLREMPAPESNK